MQHKGDLRIIKHMPCSVAPMLWGQERSPVAQFYEMSMWCKRWESDGNCGAAVRNSKCIGWTLSDAHFRLVHNLLVHSFIVHRRDDTCTRGRSMICAHHPMSELWATSARGENLGWTCCVSAALQCRSAIHMPCGQLLPGWSPWHFTCTFSWILSIGMFFCRLLVKPP